MKNDPSLRVGETAPVHTSVRPAGALSNIKRVIFVTTLLLALVGGAGQASADPGKGGQSGNVPASSSGGHGLRASGVTWE